MPFTAAKMHTVCTLVTLIANVSCTLCILCTLLSIPCIKYAHECFMEFRRFVPLNSMFMPMTGSKWYNQSTGLVLTAARRGEKCGLDKTRGDLAGSLQLCIWRRAEDPGKMTYQLVGGGAHARGFTALENPLWFKRGPPYYVNDHPVLKYLGKKIANFLHDYHRDWFPGLGLPPSNGKHNQLSPFHIKKLL